MKLLSVVIVFVVSGCEVFGQQLFRSLDDVLKYVDEHNIEIETASVDHQLSSASVRQAHGALVPSLSVTGAFTDNITIQPTLVPAEMFGGETGTFQEIEFGKRFIYNAGISLQLDVVNVPSWLQVRVSKYMESASAIREKKSRADVHHRVAEAYYTYLLMVEVEMLARENFDVVKETWQHAENRFYQGMIGEIAFNSSSIQVKLAENTLLVAVENRRYSLGQMKRLLGLAASDSVNFLEELAPVGLVAAPDQEVNQMLDVQLARAELLTAKQTLSQARSAFMPTLSAVYTFGSQWNGDVMFDFTGINSLPQQYWGLRFSLPLLSHGNRRFQMEKAKMELRLQELKYESIEKTSALDNEDLRYGLIQMRASLMASNEILLLYEKNDRHAADKLKSGQISEDERLKAFQDLVNYKMEYVKNLVAFHIKASQLRIRQGKL
jgi:outer membrane protein TolC